MEIYANMGFICNKTYRINFSFEAIVQIMRCKDSIFLKL